MEPLIMGTEKSGQPPHNGQTVHPLPVYCPYTSTSKEGTTSEQCLSHYSEVQPYTSYMGGGGWELLIGHKIIYLNKHLVKG